MKMVTLGNPFGGGGEGNANFVLDGFLLSISKYLKKSPGSLEKYLDEGIYWRRISGLDSIRRIGDATMTQSPEAVILDGTVGFPTINALVYVEKNVWWWVWFIGNIQAEVSNLQLGTKLKIGLMGDTKPEMDSLKVKGWGNITTKITEGNWFATVLSWCPFITHSVLKDVLPGKLQAGAEHILRTVKLTLPKLVISP